MNDQLNPVSILALCEHWQKLKRALFDCDELCMEFFEKTFKNTEQCLRQCVTAATISKSMIPLIADAYAFVDAEREDDNVQIQAAKILTERMLYQYVVNENVDEKNASCVTVYNVRTKRQIAVDFSNVTIALSMLVKALQVS